MFNLFNKNKNNYYSPPESFNLHRAIKNGRLKKIQSLIRNCADVNEVNNFGDTPLSQALFCYNVPKNIEIIKELLKYGASVDEIEKYSCKPLYLAARYQESPEIVQEIIKYDFNVDARNKYGCTALIGSLLNPHDHKRTLLIVKELLNAGVSVNKCDVYGRTPLHIAVIKCKEWSVIQELLNHGADINAKDGEKETPLYFAIRNGHVDVIKKLLKRGASVKVGNVYDETPLHVALKRKEQTLEIIQLMLKHGANVNEKCYFDTTPLSIVWLYKLVDLGIPEELINHGASVHESFIPCVLQHISEKNINDDLMKELVKYALIEHTDSIYCFYCEKITENYPQIVQIYTKEISDMKKEYIVEKITVYDILVQNCNNYYKVFSNGNDIFSKYNRPFLQFVEKFPSYHNIILNRLASRKYLLKILYDIPVVVEINEKIINIQPCFQVIGQYLSKVDLKNVIFALTN